MGGVGDSKSFTKDLEGWSRSFPGGGRGDENSDKRKSMFKGSHRKSLFGELDRCLLLE